MIRRFLGEALGRYGAPFLFTFGGDSARLQGILVDFSRGIGCGLEGVSRDRLQEEERNIIWDRRSFFREGYALALAARTALRGPGGNPESRNRGLTPFRMMHYTGYGFWNGCAETLPLPRLNESTSAWTDVDDYPLFYPFLVGGRSFGRLIRARAVTSELLRSFEREAKPAFVDSAWHGAGRALWFRAPGRPEALIEMLGTYAPAFAALKIGLGFAMTYTQIATPDRVLETIHSMPVTMQHDLKVGGGVALAALIYEMPEEEGRIRSMYGTGELGRYLHDALEAQEQTPLDADWYEGFNRNLESLSKPAAASAAS